MSTESLSLILGSLGGSAAFWVAYRLVMYNRPSHRSARIFLLLAMILPLLMPRLQQLLTDNAGAYTISYSLPEQIVGSPRPVASNTFSWMPVLAMAYALIAVAMLVRQLGGTLTLKRRFKSSAVMDHEGIQVYSETGFGPGSIGSMVFFPESEITPGILAHEAAHVRLGHRYDLALANLLCCVFWINPFVWLLRRELRLVHEFEADAYAARDAVGPEPYAKLLLTHTLGLQAPAFSHAFFHHPVKQRIAMLFTKESSRPRRTARVLTAGFAATIISASLLFIQCRQDAATPEKVSSAEVYKYVDQMPTFGGDMNDYLIKSLQYPEAARKAGSTGRCVIQFVVTKDGAVADPQVVKSSGSGLLDDEAMRVVRNMPAWKAGVHKGENVNVQFALPITFTLDDEPADRMSSFRDVENPHRAPNAAGNFECIDHNTDAYTVSGTFSSPDLKQDEPITVRFSIP